MKLYELTDQYADMLSRISEYDGEIPEGLEAELDALGGALSDKVDSVCRLIKSLEAESAAHIEEAKKQKERGAALLNRSERLEAYVLRCMEAANVKKAGKLLTATLVQSSGRVAISDEKKVPPAYWRQKLELDRAAIREKLLAGDAVEGCALERPMSVRIR